MFFEPGHHKEHGLPHDPFKALIAPRPIGWISVMSKAGALNLSPYSYFNAFGTSPPMVGFSSEGPKDAVTFAIETGEFVCSLTSFELIQQMSMTSAPLPRGVSEFDHAGLETAPSRLVRPPRVARSPAALECKVVQIVTPSDIHGKPTGTMLVLGQVIGIHIDDKFIENGIVQTAAMELVARCGYRDYAVLRETITLQRPSGGGD